MDVDTAFANLQKIAADVQKNIQTIETEQDARFQIIDLVLVEVLGWERAEIKQEPHTASGYVDYLVHHGNRNRLVVEAKRTRAPLLNSVSTTMQVYKLHGPSLKDAQEGIQQAARYCVEKGVPTAALTNGIAWIAFLGYRSDGLGADKTRAIVFPTLKAVEEHFAAFYDLFSKQGVLSKNNLIQIAKAEGVVIGHQEILTTPIKPIDIRLQQKSELAVNLERVFAEFFSDMSGDKNAEMVRACFVETPESQNADAHLEKITRELLSYVETISAASGGELIRDIQTAVETKRGEAVVIIGNKGAGKSTFIDRFFEMILDPVLRKKCLLIRIDISKSNGDSKTLPGWLTKRLREEIEGELYGGRTPEYDELMGIFFRDYQRWRDGEFKHLYVSDKNQFKIEFGRHLYKKIDDDEYEYVLNLLRHAIRSRLLMPCIVFDNADHFRPEFQDVVFQYGQAVLRTVLAFVISPITDRTVWQLSKSGALQSYATKSFYLPAPPTQIILQKRIEYIRMKTEGNEAQRAGFFLSKGIRVDVKNIRAFALCLEEIFVASDFLSRRIGGFVNYEIRRSLKLCHRIITSPSLRVEDLVAAFLVGGQPKIPRERMWLALLDGNYNYFSEGDSDFVLNVFKIRDDDITSPLAKIRVLRLLNDWSIRAGSPADAYMQVGDIERYFEPMGLSARTIAFCLADMMKYGLVERYDPSEDTLEMEQRVGITPNGVLHLEIALTDNVYIEQMALVTPVRFAQTAQDIRAAFQLLGAATRERYQQVRNLFLRYCLEQDRTFLHVPDDTTYDGQKMVAQELQARWIT
jgi:energy-coupling factor transporter ATP-binding protein EcfA2